MDLAVNFLDPRSLVETFGAIGVLAIIFAETGLLVGFFLPGDSLLFTAGIFTSSATASLAELPLPLLLVGTPLCAIAGAQLGFHLGARYGPRLFARPDSRLFRQEYVDKAEYYFTKFGPAKAVLLARFIPIVRTFLNPVAGMLGMDARRFFVWNVIGGVLWTDGIILLGHYAGSKIPSVDRYIIPGIAVIVILSVIPIIREMYKARKAGVTPGDQGREDSHGAVTGEHSR